MREKSKLVIQVVGTESPPERLTITPIVIQSAKSIFVFVKGKERGEVLAQLMANQDGVESEPILLVLGATFILDTVAFAKLD